MEKLCDDISSQILIRLQSKNIAQLRCVCKRWNTLLGEASFIKSHRSISNTDKDETLLMFNARIPFKAYSSASPDIELINFIKFPVNFPPVEDLRKKITVIGAANGLICFSVGYCDDHAIHVWNPSLSALLTVPPYAKNGGYKIVSSFRFGFDPKSDDYQIIQLVQPDKQSEEWLQVKVYSMRSGCWKLITPSPPPYRFSHFYDHGDIYVCADGHDGHLHWLCSKQDDSMMIQNIVAFDLAAESFSQISLPDHINFDCHHRLGIFGGKVCVISRSVDGCYCEAWVMDQYRSWVKNGFSHIHKDGLYAYGFTLKNNFIYYEFRSEVFHLYNPAAQFNKVKTFQKERYLGHAIIIPYVESLVWVTPPTC